jgi:selenocysteine lyase/cysteine desulfurase
MHRELFPVTKSHVFLNNAAESPLNTRNHERVSEYLATVLESPLKKPPHASVRQEVRRLLSELLGGSAEDFACTTSTCHGLNIVAAGIDWQPGDNVVMPDEEHWSNAFPWLALKEKGVEVRVASLTADKACLPESIEALVDDRTRVVAVAHVQFATGFRVDLKRMSSIAHSKGALLVVDGIQAAGACPLDLVEDGVDVYACAGFKWLLGMPGTGFLYVSKAAQPRIKPTAPGMFAADNGPKLEGRAGPVCEAPLAFHGDARQYEAGSIAYSLFFGWAAGLELLVEIGVQAIFERNQKLAGMLIDGLADKPHVRIVSPVGTAEGRSQIVVVTLGGTEANRVKCEQLAEHSVVVANRGETVRIAANFFNTEEEIEKLLTLL